MIIVLTPDIERRLAEQARKLETTPEQLTLAGLRERFGPAATHDIPGETPGTLADFLQGHIGILHSSEHVPGGAHMSEDSSKQYAAGLLRAYPSARVSSEWREVDICFGNEDRFLEHRPPH